MSLERSHPAPAALAAPRISHARIGAVQSLHSHAKKVAFNQKSSGGEAVEPRLKSALGRSRSARGMKDWAS